MLVHGASVYQTLVLVRISDESILDTFV